ncbi:MAG: hypothetical protein HY327_07630 [Chloroflexi bacterium]|nr:hypothetical protein [Chloroflexota bacterium]
MTIDFANILNAALLVALLISAAALVLVSTWRLALFFLVMQYAVLTLMLTQFVTPAVALVRFVSGGLVALIFLITAPGAAKKPTLADPFALSNAFRLLAALFAALCILAITLSTNFLGLNAQIQFGSLWLIATGLLIAMLARHALQFGWGILVLTAGFGLLEMAIEGSLFLYGLLNIADLIIALVVAHLVILSPEVEGGRRRGEME